MNEFNLHVIGCGSALSMHGRHPSAQVVRYNQLQCLIDCGEGTQDRLREAGIKSFKIDLIFISHLHGDHVFGLPGLLSSFSHLKRTAPLTVFGPVGLRGFLESIITFTSLKITYPLHIVENDADGCRELWFDGELQISAFPLNHRVPCNGYIFRERKQKPRFIKEKVEAHRLTPLQIKAVEKGDNIVASGIEMPAAAFLHPPSALLSYAYCSDTRYDQRITEWIKGVSVLYHETTFMEDKLDLADQTGHSTTRQAAKIAAESGAGCLITGHYSSRYKDLQPLLDEAKEVFDHALIAEEGKKYDLRSLANRGKY